MHFFYLKNSVKIEQKMQKTRKIANILKTAGKSQNHQNSCPRRYI